MKPDSRDEHPRNPDKVNYIAIELINGESQKSAVFQNLAERREPSDWQYFQLSCSYTQSQTNCTTCISERMMVSTRVWDVSCITIGCCENQF